MPKGKADVQQQIPEVSAAWTLRKRKQRLKQRFSYLCDCSNILVPDYLPGISRWTHSCTCVMSERDTHMKRQWERVSMRISVIVYMGFFFVRLNQTECVHTSVYASALYMQMHASVHWCMQMCVSSCETASQYKGGVSSDRAYVVHRAEYHRDTRHSTMLCRDYDPDKSTSTIVSILSWLQASDRALPNPRHPALTFLRAASPREIAADELLEMLKTAKLGSVTGNLQGWVLAGISDRSLSTQGGLTLISTTLSPWSNNLDLNHAEGWVALRIPTGLSSVVCSRKTDRPCDGRLFLESRGFQGSKSRIAGIRINTSIKFQMF